METKFRLVYPPEGAPARRAGSRPKGGKKKAICPDPEGSWLHGFYSSHAEPYPIKVATLWRLSGSENKELYSFRQEIREALAELQAVTGWEWEIDEHDLVHVRKTKMHATQGRHLVRKTLKASGKKRKGE